MVRTKKLEELNQIIKEWFILAGFDNTEYDLRTNTHKMVKQKKNLTFDKLIFSK